MHANLPVLRPKYQLVCSCFTAQTQSFQPNYLNETSRNIISRLIVFEKAIFQQEIEDPKTKDNKFCHKVFASIWNTEDSTSDHELFSLIFALSEFVVKKNARLNCFAYPNTSLLPNIKAPWILLIARSQASQSPICTIADPSLLFRNFICKTKTSVTYSTDLKANLTCKTEASHQHFLQGVILFDPHLAHASPPPAHDHQGGQRLGICG